MASSHKTRTASPALAGFALVAAACASSMRVTGTITESYSGEPVPFVQVSHAPPVEHVWETVAISDSTGRFALDIPADGKCHVLYFFFVGYLPVARTFVAAPKGGRDIGPIPFEQSATLIVHFRYLRGCEWPGELPDSSSRDTVFVEP